MKMAWKSVATSLLLCTALASASPGTWEFRDGRWQQLPAAATQPAPSDPTLDRIEQFLDAGQWKPARVAILDWLKANPASPQRDRGLFLIARVYYEKDDRI